MSWLCRLSTLLRSYQAGVKDPQELLAATQPCFLMLFVVLRVLVEVNSTFDLHPANCAVE